METLRSMYKAEIDGQSEKLEQERISAKDLVAKLRDSIAAQKKEIEELNM